MQAKGISDGIAFGNISNYFTIWDAWTFTKKITKPIIIQVYNTGIKSFLNSVVLAFRAFVDYCTTKWFGHRTK